MAHKSKTQRAKASAARAARKIERANEESAAASGVPEATAQQEEEPKKGLFSKLAKSDKADEQQDKPEKKADKPVKKQRFAFLRDIRSELKRVTWPTKNDVLRWSVVVVAALLFFGIYVAVLDNVIITPLLVAVSGLGA